MKIQKKSYSAVSPFMSFMLFMVERKRGAPRRKSTRRQPAQNPAHAWRAHCPPTSESGSEFSNSPVVSPPFALIVLHYYTQKVVLKAQGANHWNIDR